MVYGGQVWVWAVVIATLLMMVALGDFGQHTGVCFQCGGKGSHRDDCPSNKE